ncbi:XRE family transcriptional regulator [Lactobacillus sp. ESL0236]|uniref:helix-turn-helix domain-containing protein n=1 Tax=unclassified Lactobacillus TaxID=2620435 RepID=UPI000EFC71D4|nr:MULTISPECIES: helix-turn-helix transcriptional regulator [unclassified Lactobacillus]MCO6527812.1 helix-turn-helix transcriptional regulator [Lactobacillus sp.]RMC38152.1 XRE family transcriptional regulator [Lactobacillus sp. ESL0237]RMC42453.1 XRE family transcriptional regulator [Lactobacillus sp. ESL0234]RMC42619.1 XRE family transcriptional regulator [Lactobacillus sp. ESL0236]
MSISKRIKDARLNKRYTQKELADLLNVKSTTVSGWELGRNEPSIETLKKLSKILNVSFDYLAGVSNEERTKNINSDFNKQDLDFLLFLKKLSYDMTNDEEEKFRNSVGNMASLMKDYLQKKQGTEKGKKIL